MKSKSMFCNGKRYDEKIHACMFNVSLLSLPKITKMPACFTFQSYNDVAEDMRGDEDTKAELHQQLDVRNTNTYSLFRYSVRYYIELLPGKNSCKRIFVI